MRNTVKHAQKFIHVGLCFPSPYIDRLHVVGYSYASFATNEEWDSQLGVVVLLVDSAGKMSVLSFMRHTWKHVLRSALGATIFVLYDAIEEALRI